MSTTYNLSEECADRDYRGAGKAWAAVVGGEVVALQYMDHPIPGHGEYNVPEWIKAVQKHANGLNESYLPVCHGSAAWVAMAAAAESCKDCPRPPRRERYRPTELLAMAHDTLAALDATAFAKHREKCRAELAEIGEVLSGVCSCFEFIAK